jgi:hypothetical protein
MLGCTTEASFLSKFLAGSGVGVVPPHLREQAQEQHCEMIHHCSACDAKHELFLCCQTLVINKPLCHAGLSL